MICKAGSSCVPVTHLIHHVPHTSPVIPWEARGITRTADGGKEAKRGNRECQQEGHGWGEFDGVKSHVKAEGSGEEGARVCTLQCGRGSVSQGTPSFSSRCFWNSPSSCIIVSVPLTIGNLKTLG